MLRLSPAVYDDIIAHAEAAAPAEACGLLAGYREESAALQERSRGDEDDASGADGHDVEGQAPGAGPRAVESHRATNVAPNPEITYEIDPEEQYRLMDEIEAAGRSLVGFYHSHPGGPHGPSATDQARATWEGYHYLIASLGGQRPVLDAWVWTGERFAREDLVVETELG